MRGKPLEEALRLAVDFTLLCIQVTCRDENAPWYGVEFEKSTAVSPRAAGAIKTGGGKPCSETSGRRKIRSARKRRSAPAEARRGILAVNGREGYPYAIPINYYYDREAQKIYFHGARAGHKVEAIRACDKVCFTVYGGETIREEAWAPYLRSVVVFGRCRLLEQSRRPWRC